jgi:tRNA(adenine34) deaminase
LFTKILFFYSLFKDFIVILQKKKTIMTQEEQLKKDEQYMRKALVEAQQAYDEGEIPVGAVIVCNDRIISRAHNLTETLCDVTAHAEMQAITAAMSTLGGKYLSECTLYVTVEPCVMCGGALAWSQIGRVVYGASDPKRGYTTFSERIMHPKTQVVRGVLEQECEQLMRRFFADLRK